MTMLNKNLKAIDETDVQRRRRIYNQHRLQEEASIGLDQLIKINSKVKNRTEFAALIGRSKSFVTKILDSHNFTLATLSDAYFALGYVVHLTLAPRDAGKLRLPTIEQAKDLSGTTVLFVDFRKTDDNFKIPAETMSLANQLTQSEENTAA